MAQDKPLDVKRIQELLSDIEVLCYPEIDSTNTEAKRLVKSGKKPPFLILAETQSAGRGRLGRSFYSPSNTGIYMSLVLSESLDSDSADITSAAAVAVCKAAESLSGKSLGIKPVNDIYLDKKKICGILCESVYDGTPASPVIIGVGMNVSTTLFPEDLPSAGSLNCDASREELICEITKELLFAVKVPLDTLMPYYNSHRAVL